MTDKQIDIDEVMAAKRLIEALQQGENNG